ncbi:MAG: ABC transporter permease, partial [Vallitaleaceae bacterium]|nr:ABC transporter permease [Vallitaleaceae bacterium]
MNRKWFAAPYGIWALVFILIPLFMLFYFGITIETKEGITFSLDNLKKVFEPIYFTAFLRSIN